MAEPILLTLADGNVLPALGFGTWDLKPGSETQAAVEEALAAGYRHIDTAMIYENEADVGAAIRASGIPRAELWVTTKLWNSDHGRQAARAAFERSLSLLQLDYVDGYLQHWPMPQRVESWRSMEDLVDEGVIRSLGVCNFLPRHFDGLELEFRHRPVINQFELSPFLIHSRAAMIERSLSAGLVVEAYAPLTCGRRLDNETVVRIAASHERSPAQVLLRWSLQHGFVVLPRSKMPERIRENANLFDFSLTDDDLAALDALDDGFFVYEDPEDFV